MHINSIMFVFEQSKEQMFVKMKNFLFVSSQIRLSLYVTSLSVMSTSPLVLRRQ